MSDDSLVALKQRKEMAENHGFESYADHLDQKIAEREGNTVSGHDEDAEPINDDLAALEERKESAEEASRDAFTRILQGGLEDNPDYEPPKGE